MGLKEKISRLDEVCANGNKELEPPEPLENKSDSDLRCEYFALTWAYEQTSDPLGKDIYKETANELADELTRRGIRVVRPGEKSPAREMESADPATCKQLEDEIADKLTEQADTACMTALCPTCGSDLIRNWHSKIDKLQEYLDLYSQTLALMENLIAESSKSGPGSHQPAEPESIQNKTARIKEITAIVSTIILPQQEFCDKVNRLAAVEPCIDKIVRLPWTPLLKQLSKLLADRQHLMVHHPEVFPESEDAEYTAAIAKLADVLARSVNNGGKNEQH